MKKYVAIVMTMLAVAAWFPSEAQSGKVQTLFDGKRVSSGGYGAINSGFTTIRGKYTHMAGVYGGWYVNNRFMLGLGASASTNRLSVPDQFSAFTNRDMTWQYGQFGLMTEYVVGSDKPVHLVFQLFSGAGFTLQYERDGWHGYDYDDVHDENWFVVAEPGVQLELNLFKWMRLSPGISYRATFGSEGLGLKDKDLSALSYRATLKFGKWK